MSLHLKKSVFKLEKLSVHPHQRVSQLFFMSKIKVYCDLTKHIWAKLIRSGLDMDIKYKLAGFWFLCKYCI